MITAITIYYDYYSDALNRMSERQSFPEGNPATIYANQGQILC